MRTVYPHPIGTPKTYIAGGVPGGLHETAGLPGYWALDFMAPGGTRVLIPEDSRIFKLSGHNPAEGVHNGDIFGWNVYFKTDQGIKYFATHLGNYDVKLGQRVKQGDIYGHVGHWPHDPGRSHTHLGVYHPGGEAAAKRYIIRIAESIKVTGQWPK